MKVKIKSKKEIEVKTLDVKAGVRYWEDTEVNGVEDETGELIPCRVEDYWCPSIDIETGIITNWEKGKTANVHYKICDDGIYTLRGANGKVVKELDGYVPNILCQREDGYGDYIIMLIDENGQIADWNDFDLSEFENEEED